MAQQRDQNQQRQAGQQPDRSFGSQDQGRDNKSVNTGRSGLESDLDSDIETNTPRRNENLDRPTSEKSGRMDQARSQDSKKDL